MDGFNIQLFPDTYVMHHAFFVSSSIPQLNQCLESLTTWTSWGVTFIINFQCQFMYNHFTTIKWYESFKFQKISSGDFFIILVALIFNVNIYNLHAGIHHPWHQIFCWRGKHSSQSCMDGVGGNLCITPFIPHLWCHNVYKIVKNIQSHIIQLIIHCFRDWQEKPSISSIDRVKLNELEFPAITVCPEFASDSMATRSILNM